MSIGAVPEEVLVADRSSFGLDVSEVEVEFSAGALASATEVSSAEGNLR